MSNKSAPSKLAVTFLSAILLTVIFEVRAFSAALTWDILTCSTDCNNLAPTGVAPSIYGNTRTYTSGGQVLTVSAFATSNNDGTGNFVASYLGSYPPTSGLGVNAPTGATPATQTGDGNGSSNQHAVENSGRNDLIVFKFPNSNFIPLSVALSVFGAGGDTDITAYVGGSGNLDFTTLSYATLAANGFTQYTSANAAVDGTNSNRTAGLNLSNLNLAGQYLVLGAKNSDTDDQFKVGVITADIKPQGGPPQVAEPSSLLLLGAGLLGISRRILRGRGTR